MKKYFYVFFVVAIFVGSSCKKKEVFKNDKEAIIAVIEEETDAYRDSDYKRLAATNVKDKTNIRITAQKEGYVYLEGWDKIGLLLKRYLKRNMNYENMNQVKSNYKIKVYEGCAWAVFDDIIYGKGGDVKLKSIGTRFLEKKNGNWKIVYMSDVNTTSYSR